MAILDKLNLKFLTDNGLKHVVYFKRMEQFYGNFYRTENAYQNSLRFLAEGDVENSIESIRRCQPEQIIEQFASGVAAKGITKGESGLIISLNLGWLPYIENQKQALGEKPIIIFCVSYHR